MDPVTPSAEALLEHAWFLRRIAGGILHDADTADDVAEDAIVAALGERPAKIAQRLDVPLDTVRTRLRHARP